MSLKIWLPLNGNLENQGLLNVSMTNANATIADNGKIGKCYYFNGTDARIYANNVSLSNTQMSGCCWVKAESLSGSSYLFSLGSNTGGEGQQIAVCWSSFSNSLWIGANGSYLNSEYNLSLNTWYHICFTYKGNSSKLYVNGQLVYSETNVNSPKTQTCFCIGARNNSTSGAGIAFSYPFQGWMNDVRIYDHCLSFQEIKKISQGLILHYPLNNKGFGKPNIIKGTNKFSGWHYTRTSYPSVSGKIMTFAASGTDWSDANSPTIPWSDVEGKTITVSLDVRSDDFNYTTGSGFYVDIARKSIGPTATDYTTRRLESPVITFSKTVVPTSGIAVRTISTQWKRYTYTISNLSASYFKNTYNGGGGDWFGLDIWQYCNKSVQIKNVKIEIGDSPTPWVPHVDDVEYNLCQINNNKVADISGFNNNGTYINKDYLLHSADTIIYKTSLSFSNNTFGIIINKYLKSILNNDCTVSFWIYSNDDGGHSVYFGSFATGPTWSIEKAVNNYFRDYWNGAVDQGCGSNSIVTNSMGWTHISFVKTGSTSLKLYKNGELVWSTTAAHNNLNFPEVFRIGRDTRGDTTSYNGLMSDFRIYCTALTQEAVMELYKNRR